MAKKEKKKTKINKKALKILISMIIIIVLAYGIYKIIQLIIVPSDMTMVENGIISDEENAIRICNKK